MKPSPQCDVWRWDLWQDIRFRLGLEGEAPHDEINSLLRRETQDGSLFLPSEGTGGPPSEDQEGVSHKHQICLHFDTEAPSLQNCGE